MNWLEFPDSLLVEELERRGYLVRHKTQARIPLSWNRTAPFPEGLDFKAEALEKLRTQITTDAIDFEVHPSEGLRPEIHRAVLRLL